MGGPWCPKGNPKLSSFFSKHPVGFQMMVLQNPTGEPIQLERLHIFHKALNLFFTEWSQSMEPQRVVWPQSFFHTCHCIQESKLREQVLTWFPFFFCGPREFPGHELTLIFLGIFFGDFWQNTSQFPQRKHQSSEWPISLGCTCSHVLMARKPMGKSEPCLNRRIGGLWTDMIKIDLPQVSLAISFQLVKHVGLQSCRGNKVKFGFRWLQSSRWLWLDHCIPNNWSMMKRCNFGQPTQKCCSCSSPFQNTWCHHSIRERRGGKVHCTTHVHLNSAPHESFTSCESWKGKQLY